MIEITRPAYRDANGRSRREPVTASNLESVTAHPLARGLQEVDRSRNVDYGLGGVGGATTNEDYGLRHLAD